MRCPMLRTPHCSAASCWCARRCMAAVVLVLSIEAVLRPATGPPGLDTLERAFSITSPHGDWGVSIARRAAAAEHRWRHAHSLLSSCFRGLLNRTALVLQAVLRVCGLLPGHSQPAVGTGSKLSVSETETSLAVRYVLDLSSPFCHVVTELLKCGGPGPPRWRWTCTGWTPVAVRRRRCGTCSRSTQRCAVISATAACTAQTGSSGAVLGAYLASRLTPSRAGVKPA